MSSRIPFWLWSALAVVHLLVAVPFIFWPRPAPLHDVWGDMQWGWPFPFVLEQGDVRGLGRFAHWSPVAFIMDGAMALLSGLVLSSHAVLFWRRQRRDNLIRLCIFTALLLVLCIPRLPAAETANDLLQKAKSAWEKKQPGEAIKLAGEAIELDPKNAEAYLLRGVVYESLDKHAEAIADFDQTLKLDPKVAVAYDHRGSEQFKLGKIKESIEDFDAYLKLQPKETPKHWKRGISYYYAGRYEDGAKQFEAYQDVDGADVENVVWRYLCMARSDGVEKARAGLLKVGEDKRVPLMRVYDLYAGKAKPEDVLAAVEEGKPSKEEKNLRHFYAHLYLGLYYEAAGDKKKTLEHMKSAVEDYPIRGYMSDVARVHLELRTKEKEKP